VLLRVILANALNSNLEAKLVHDQSTTPLTASTRLKEVVNEPLSGVSFVQDYVEFQFDGRVIRVFTDPILRQSQETYDPSMAEWRNALCSLIGKRVTKCTVVESEKIELEFSDGSILHIPLSVSPESGPEAIHFVPGTDMPIEIW